MKRAALERHLRENSAQFVRHGAGHEKWRGPNGSISVVPRHREIGPGVVRAICKQLGIPAPPNPK